MNMKKQIGFIGVGRMGAAMVRRISCSGISCVVYDKKIEAQANIPQKIKFTTNLNNFIESLSEPKQIWLMLPAGIVDTVITELKPYLKNGDTIIDGGNSHFTDDIRRANELKNDGINYLDVGVSGGVWGEKRGYCLMIGGSKNEYEFLEPVFKALAPGVSGAKRTQGRENEPSPAENGYLYCGENGAGHFVKMVHNGIEYGLMAAYAEGFSILKHANQGLDKTDVDAETAPLESPMNYKYELPLKDISELWRRGSVISSWLLDLIAQEMFFSEDLDNYTGKVSDSGEGRWTSIAAIDLGVPTPVLTTALYSRFFSQQSDSFSNRVQSAMRHAFGGHQEKNTLNGGEK
ncbi:phosphogluconate dehydrogenase (NAD(+)-dependent, decarboxylating) [Providencia alcalifaciens]|uniref:phosphogluconate dehydrogenase (NAD(+)-dependent, decarboxylating) n=1 Tax=Providencia alcalifaciens TaxID=126385 RepID=UPI003D9989DF